MLQFIILAFNVWILAQKVDIYEDKLIIAVDRKKYTLKLGSVKKTNILPHSYFQEKMDFQDRQGMEADQVQKVNQASQVGLLQEQMDQMEPKVFQDSQVIPDLMVSKVNQDDLVQMVCQDSLEERWRLQVGTILN